MKILLILFFLPLIASSDPIVGVANDPLTSWQDLRYIGPPVRDAKGVIVRSTKVRDAFQVIHPCPSTGLKKGACPGWFKDHPCPLACGCADAVWNMQWLDTETKKRKDASELKIYGGIVPGTICTAPTPEKHL
jgi:hypothetical protein